MEDIKFYLKKEGVDEEYLDLESTFQGMKYLQCKGLEDKGKPKNKYTETYADSNELRVHEPTDVCLEATTITFTFLFVGEDRQSVYDSFYEHIKSGKFYYYDTKREKKAYITLMEAVKPSDDIYKGSTPYIKADFKFQNIWGKCEPITNN